MEDTLRVPEALSDFNESKCLNPCFNGRYSQRVMIWSKISVIIVLILVLMEDTLRVENNKVYSVNFAVS